MVALLPKLYLHILFFFASKANFRGEPYKEFLEFNLDGFLSALSKNSNEHSEIDS